LSGSSKAKLQTVKLAVGAVYYADRTYKIKSVPSYLANTSFIKAANDDKINTQNTFLTFKVSRASTVYVAYDPRAKKLPTWLQGFTKVSEQLGIDDPKLAGMNLYKKDYAAGTISVGGNLAGSATGALCQYILIVKEK
ncbi:hypothetical protein IM792_20205, partial [Mucilaginibacter sp. JRF]|uniref:hypothetical protein n=1 Tax=Mucilaginibacter sp. JRF TaxID=2780088 RepID=UPI001A0B1BD3